jgi:DNA-binding transcriptional LysR family regulator
MLNMHSLNLSRVDLNLLVVFDAVAQTRSVTRAAERLALSQPAVSHALGRLRTLIGDPLFVRGRDGLVLTARGQTAIGPIADILAKVGAVLAPVAFDPATATRVFRIGVSDYAVSAALPDVVRALRSDAPGVTLEARPFGEHSLGDLETGELDCSFWGGGPLNEPFRARPLFSDRRVGLVCASHPLASIAKRRPVSIEEYLAYPHAQVTIGHIATDPIDAALAKIGRARRVAITTPGYAVNFAILVKSDLILSPPARLAREAGRLGFVAFNLPVSVHHNAYALIWHRRTDADRANEWLRDLIIARRVEEPAPIHAVAGRARRGTATANASAVSRRRAAKE